MTKTEAETELEYLETSEEAKALGLRRIKRRHFTQKSEMKLRDCQVVSEIRIDADLYNFLKTEAEKKSEDSVDRALNEILREAIERNKMRDELLNDAEFVNRLKEKLAA